MSHFNKRIIIEGCDGVGKDTFIKLFMAYIQGLGLDGVKADAMFNGVNLVREAVPALIRKRDGLLLTDNTLVRPVMTEKIRQEYHKHPNRFHSDMVVDMPRWGTVFSSISIHSQDSSPEAKRFLQLLDAGKVTDQNEIAQEYLQIHYDLERLACTLEETHSLIIHNRSLVSYYAMQIHALKLTQHEDNWGKLWRWSDQKNAIFVHLTMPEDALRERLRARQKGDFRGEVEDLYMSKALTIDEGFRIMKRSDDWAEVFTFDVNCPTAGYVPYFEQILQSHANRHLHNEVQNGNNLFSNVADTEGVDELPEDEELV